LPQQSLRQAVKVSALAGQAVHANHHMGGARITPSPIGHAVMALRVGAIHKFKLGCCGFRGQMGHGNGRQSESGGARNKLGQRHNGLLNILIHLSESIHHVAR
jgi:predicted ATP-dependent Lon-type protease